MRRTKIVCTIGPATRSKSQLEALVDVGMNVARLNFSHGTHEEHAEVIQWLKEVRKERGIALGILLDTKGPEIRIREMESIEAKVGDEFVLCETKEAPDELPITPAHILKEIEVGDTILIDDGYVACEVVDNKKGRVRVKVTDAGTIKGGKGVNVPEQQLSLPFMTDKDIDDIVFGVKNGVEMIAASFTMSVDHILAIKELLQKHEAPETMVIAKIESRTGVEQFEKIVQVADGVMIARGDLGVEINLASVPHLQKWMIRECCLRAKPCIVATQMLESMITNSMPTRAEASDVANSVFDGASAVMLSGETAVGKFPLKSVRIMDEVIHETENFFEHEEYFAKSLKMQFQDIPSGVSLAAVNTAYSLDAGCIFVCSKGGHTARRISRYRPRAGLIVLTPSIMTYHKTSLFWGTEAILARDPDIVKEYPGIACDALQRGWLTYGELVVITTGKPYFQSFTTNTIIVESVGEVILRGKGMETDVVPISTEVVFLLSTEEKSVKDCKGKIVVITRYTEELKPYIEASKGVILQNHPHDFTSQELLDEIHEAKKIPYIYECDGAMSLLREGDFVRFEPNLGLVFEGGSPTEEEMMRQCRYQ